MSAKKKSIRDQFRTEVFERDDHRCRMCGAAGRLDAHHITDRSEMPNGGYVAENGIALCAEGDESCHKKAEEWHSSGKTISHDGYSPEDLYEVIGSSYAMAVEASHGLAEEK